MAAIALGRIAVEIGKGLERVASLAVAQIEVEVFTDSGLHGLAEGLGAAAPGRADHEDGFTGQAVGEADVAGQLDQARVGHSVASSRRLAIFTYSSWLSIPRA